jgi:ADP-glucose pyrophosphorylase
MEAWMGKYILNIHSFIDLITNSSTEIYVADPDKVSDTVMKALKSIDDYDMKFYPLTDYIKDIYDEDYYDSKEDMNKAINDFLDEHKIKNMHNAYILESNYLPSWISELLCATGVTNESC